MQSLCSDDPPPYKDGVRINSPHYLCKMVEPKPAEPYTLVISQYEKNNTIHYTLRVYATCDFSLTRFIDPYKSQYEKKVSVWCVYGVVCVCVCVCACVCVCGSVCVCM